MRILNYLGRDLTEKRNTKTVLQITVGTWVLYGIILSFIYRKNIYAALFFDAIALVGMFPSLYQLKKGIYLKKGEKYVKPKLAIPKQRIRSAKKEMSREKK